MDAEQVCRIALGLPEVEEWFGKRLAAVRVEFASMDPAIV